jgi:glutamyl-tRNA synthetase
MNAYRGRFAPSPTGALHLGAARTALLAWRRARQEQGSFILRVDDLDSARVRKGSLDGLLEELRWLGLAWDEGPDVGGPCGPYIQSRRLDRYGAAFEALRSAGRLYACTCTRSEIAGAASAPHGEEALYPRSCRPGPSHPGRTPAWRFRMDGPQDFVDSLAGPQAGVCDDFVVRRADGVFAYQLASAVDDADMGVTEVLRADDLLPSASRQAALLRALGRPVPAWRHVPPLLGPDRQRLAKRHASVSVAAYRAAGWSAEDLRGLLLKSLDSERFLGPWPADSNPNAKEGRHA